MSSRVIAQAAAGRQTKRRGLLIDPGLQLRALLPLLVFVVLFGVLVSTVFLFRLHRSVENEPDLGVRAILEHWLVNLHLHLWPLLLVSGLIAAYVGLRWSARVAGPAYHLHRALVELAEHGEIKPLRFRRNDELRVFEEDVTQLSQKMRLMATRNRDILFSAYTHVRHLGDRVAAGEVIPRADLEEFVNSMRAQLEKAPEISLSVRRQEGMR